MRVTHTIAAALAGILLIQSVTFAQSPRDQAIQPIPREQALDILLRNLQQGTEVRVELCGDRTVVAQFAGKIDDDLVLLVSGQRQVMPIADVVSVRRPLRPDASGGGGGAFALGAAIGAGLLVVAMVVARTAMR